jgi:hypothetical protein
VSKKTEAESGFGNQIAQLAAKRQPDLSDAPAM